MQNCHIPIYLAYAMTVYVMASIIYLLGTRFIGTPFNDSLTPKQIKIKNKSIYQRKKIFFIGLISSCVIIFICKPYHTCMKL